MLVFFWVYLVESFFFVWEKKGNIGFQIAEANLVVGGGFKYIYFLCSPLLGEDFQFDEHIFQMGWFNRQLESSGRWWFYSARLWGKWSKFEELLFVFVHLHVFFAKIMCLKNQGAAHGGFLCMYLQHLG